MRLVNIGPEDFYNSNTKLILGFVWTLILRYQIQKGNNQSGKSIRQFRGVLTSFLASVSKAKQELLDWCNEALSGFTKVNDFRGR